MKQILFLLIILVLALSLSFFIKIPKLNEGFNNYTLEETTNTFMPLSNKLMPKKIDFDNDILLEDEFPITGRKTISNEGSQQLWWHYPIFKVGSYDQITNNIRYNNNPDDGTCTPASMCGALYKEIKNKSNYVKPLPEVNPDCGTRIGYFTTSDNLLPYRNNTQNILY
jgi:hypothetical protein